MYALFWFVFGAGFALLVVAAGVTLHVRRRDAWGGVPVVDDDNLIGIVTRTDLLARLYPEQETPPLREAS